MARTYSFDVKGLLKDIVEIPWTSNVELAQKYGISRERVRQLREEFALPSVMDAKEQWLIDNFDIALEGARRGKFLTNYSFIKQFPLSAKLIRQVLDKRPDLKALYDTAISEWEYSVRYPTEKVCLRCKISKEISAYYVSPSDKTRDGYARICKDCNIKAVRHYYEIRKTKEKNVPNQKMCSAVPELGFLPSNHFRNMAGANTGLQPQCNAYQDFYRKFRKKETIDRSRELARLATISYYENFRSVTAV